MTTRLPGLATLPLALALASAGGCANPDDGPEATFEDVWRDFDELYGGFELRGVDWDLAYASYRPLVDDTTSEDELFTVLTRMLAETDDGHVHLTVPGRERWSANQIYRERIGFDRFDRELVEDVYLGGEYRSDPLRDYSYGQLDGDITYVYLAMIGDQTPILARVREEAETRGGGMIIDLRHNNGGDFTWAFATLAEWTASDRPVFRSRTRDGPRRDDFTAWFEWSIAGRGTDIEFPVVVLIDRFTISAAERAVLALDTLDNVTFVGEPTSGAVATSVGRELVNGWYVTISTQEVLGLDGETIEGVGFEPDELVVNDPAMLAAGVDQALERAIELLR